MDGLQQGDRIKFQQLQSRADQAEAEVTLLLDRLNKLKSKSDSSNPDQMSENGEESADLELIKTENAKLRYRLNILKRAVEESTKNGFAKNETDRSNTMINIQARLEQLFETAIKLAFPSLLEFPPVAVIPTIPRHGDYQFNGAMEISKLLQANNIKMNPKEVSATIAAAVPKNNLIGNLQLAGAFFINIKLDTNFLSDQLKQLVVHGARPPAGIKRQRVVVDFSAPNIAKEMHVGHLRSTIIGDSLCHLLEFMGHDVLRLNHIGDWGTQFGMLLAHLEDRFPNYSTETPPIGDLQSFYKQAKIRFDSDADFKARAYRCVVKLQSHDPTYIRGWKAICDVSRREFQKIYDRLDIKVIERGESFYQERMNEVVRILEAAGLLEEDEGRKIMFSPNHKVPLTVVKSDGGYTYDTSDLATIRQRIEEEKGDWLIYVTDSGQFDHFDILFSCAEKIGWLDRSKVRVDHVGFGVVLGEDRKKFKSRSSDTIRLIDLLDEGLRRAAEKIKEREEAKKKEGKEASLLNAEEMEAAQKSIAYGCIKYADLSHNRNSEYVFSFDKMLEDKGNTAVYLLYAYTRICSIARAANVSSEQVQAAAQTNGIRIEHEKEIKLTKTLLRFPEVIVRVSQELALHTLCDYLYEISTTFTEFYQVCYCVEKDRKTDEIIKVNMDRLCLCEATAVVMAKCFSLLGLVPVQRM